MDDNPPAPPPLPAQELQQEVGQVQYLQQANHVAEHPLVLPDNAVPAAAAVAAEAAAGLAAPVQPDPVQPPPGEAMDAGGDGGGDGAGPHGAGLPANPARGQRNHRRGKIPQPRILNEVETQQKLDHWKATFLLYFSMDDTFQHYLDPDTRWFPDRPNYGFQQEVDDDFPKWIELVHILVGC